MDYELKDSGARRGFNSGSVRDTDNGKGNPHLMSTFALRRYSRLLQKGREKYGKRNWELGQPDSSYIDSLFRHAFCFMEGMKDEDHLAALLWNAAALIHNDELVSRGIYPGTLHDLADYTSPEAFRQTVVAKEGVPSDLEERSYGWQDYQEDRAPMTEAIDTLQQLRARNAELEASVAQLREELERCREMYKRDA